MSDLAACLIRPVCSGTGSIQVCISSSSNFVYYSTKMKLDIHVHQHSLFYELFNEFQQPRSKVKVTVAMKSVQKGTSSL